MPLILVTSTYFRPLLTTNALIGEHSHFSFAHDYLEISACLMIPFAQILEKELRKRESARERRHTGVLNARVTKDVHV